MFDDFEIDGVPVIESDGLLELCISTQETGEPDSTHLQMMPHPVEESEPDHHVPYSASMIKGKAEKVGYSHEQEQPHQVTQAHPTHHEQPDQFGKDTFYSSFLCKPHLSNQFNSECDSMNSEKVEAGMAIEMIPGDLINVFPLPKCGDDLFEKMHSQDDFFDKSTPVGSCDDQYEDNVKTHPPDSPTNDSDLDCKAVLNSFTDLTPLYNYLHGLETSMESDFSKLSEIEPMDSMDTDIPASKAGNGFMYGTTPSKHVGVTNDVQMEI
ncbi:uncharacterized protein [Ptychodera flava]|uniref:uncharacterized protein n=1 Tax=Ptychodera flava TaxID=63121 RepID=UPI00396A7AAB